MIIFLELLPGVTSPKRKPTDSLVGAEEEVGFAVAMDLCYNGLEGVNRDLESIC